MKIILVSGFLGSGKTRFIKSLVEKTDKSIVILENEFGDLNLDGEYLKNNNKIVLVATHDEFLIKQEDFKKIYI